MKTLRSWLETEEQAVLAAYVRGREDRFHLIMNVSESLRGVIAIVLSSMSRFWKYYWLFQVYYSCQQLYCDATRKVQDFRVYLNISDK